MVEVSAQAKRIRVSPRKARLVVDMVRGRDVTEALGLLQFTPNKAAADVSKVIKSARASAENNHDIDPEDLYVKVIFADGGPSYKRFKPRARGRVNEILKRTCHLTVILAEKEKGGSRGA
ncbi:MAG TPA: 50S ribosomal protein L22 [Thermomicrobiales bacterium]|jgi:large subunit ribosomal protein L22|nr:50S ribosomal protein L22 [Thermomicrobiales bacterium]HRA31127.1 50S ribosomal protein L22 [Thermomicrobiales bacterium]